MPRLANELSAIEVKRLVQSGWHAVGGVAGLLLQVRQSTQGAPSRSWVLRVYIAGKRKVIGLGPFPTVTLAQAREQAKQLLRDIKDGIDPVARKRAQRSAAIAAASKDKTFEECASAYIAAHSSDYSNEKHRKQWASTLSAYAFPIIGKMLVRDVGMRNVLDVLQQDTRHRNGTSGRLWDIKTETAKRTLDRIKTVLDFATVNEYRSGLNPATWKGYLDTQLASPRGLKKVKHYPALPYTHTGEFMKRLRLNDSVSARALEFLILTGVRSGSVRQANWQEIDFAKKLWIVPAEHTKAKREHRVPLPPQAIDCLKRVKRVAGTTRVFPSPTGKALSDMALSQLMRGMQERGEFKGDAVPHGFRSTFRDWAAECTNYPDELRKVASMHATVDAVKEAYQRTDLLEKRRDLMTDWADYIDGASMPVGAELTIGRKAL